MSKLKLVVNPSFQAVVQIPIAGGPPAPVLMTFKSRTRKEWDEWTAANRAIADSGKETTFDDEVNKFMELVLGWDLEEEFNRENVELLLQIYFGAGNAALRVYAEELWNNKIKN